MKQNLQKLRVNGQAKEKITAKQALLSLIQTSGDESCRQTARDYASEVDRIIKETQESGSSVGASLATLPESVRVMASWARAMASCASVNGSDRIVNCSEFVMTANSLSQNEYAVLAGEIVLAAATQSWSPAEPSDGKWTLGCGFGV
jgi:hypothetical protein